jgi:glycerol uptake facilitator-like aquaporin
MRFASFSRSSQGGENGPATGPATVSSPQGAKQLSMLNVADNTRNNVVAVLGEFAGTFMFLFMSFVGTQISNTPKPPDEGLPNTSNLLFAALAFGFSLTVNVWAFYLVTGGLFNPSVRNSHRHMTRQSNVNRLLLLCSLLGERLPCEVAWYSSLR